MKNLQELLTQRWPRLATVAQVNFRMLLTGPLSYLPGQKLVGLRGTVMSGERLPARYYYAVWLRHLVKASANLGWTGPPETVAEIGPGDALGLGLCALLCGGRRYYAFDVVRFAKNAENKKVFRELVQLFQSRAPIPDDREFPFVEPYLDSYAFPHHLLTADLLAQSLAPARLAALEESMEDLAGSAAGPLEIRYMVPWSDQGLIRPGTVDLIVSQAVLEHVAGLGEAYRAMWSWLKPGGLMSHAIDFRSHGLSKAWNGHWSQPQWLWAIMHGRRPYLLNRAPWSEHLAWLERNNFQLVRTETIQEPGGIARSQLAREFREISDADLTTRSVFLQARK